MLPTAALCACLALAPGDTPVVVTLDWPGGAPDRLAVRFENRGPAPLTVMPPLDGSDCGWRYPHYGLELAGPDGAPLPRRGAARCGNVNPSTTADFVPLRPGETFRTSIAHPAPGGTRVRLTYTARRDTTTRGLSGPPGPAVERAMQSVWEGTAVSNWVIVEVPPPAAAK